MKTDLFPVLWPLLSFPNLLAYWVQHFNSIIFHHHLHWGLKGDTDLHVARDCPDQSISHVGVYAVTFLGFVEEPTVTHWEKQEVEGKQGYITCWSTGSNFLGGPVKCFFCTLPLYAWCFLSHSLSHPSSANQWKLCSLGVPFLAYQSRPVLKIIQATHALCVFLCDFTYCIVFLILKCPSTVITSRARQGLCFSLSSIFSTVSSTWKVKKLISQSCLILCDCMDCSPPSSSVHGISQARILDWLAISSSGGSSQHRDRTLICYIAGRFFYHLSHQDN